MELKNIKLNTKFEITVYDKDGKKVEPTLISSFERVKSDGTILSTYPIVKGMFYGVDSFQPIKVNFVEGDGIYSFRGRVISKEKQGNLAYIIIEKLSEITKIQRRSFFRFDCSLDVKYKIANTEETFVKSYTGNISAGGICLKSKNPIELNIKVEVEILINEKGWRKFIGKVVRCEKDMSDKFYLNGLQFLNITDRDQKDIIDFIFKEQVKLRQKGVL